MNVFVCTYVAHLHVCYVHVGGIKGIDSKGHVQKESIVKKYSNSLL